jgi:RNA polymerase sigma-70 factor, ECF subfamily
MTVRCGTDSCNVTLTFFVFRSTAGNTNKLKKSCPASVHPDPLPRGRGEKAAGILPVSVNCESMSLAGFKCDMLELDCHVASEELARRASSGCADSFAVLTERYRVRLLQVVLGRIGRSRLADAEDIVQEALTRAWQKIDSYDFRFRFSTWLFTIALRITTDHLRRWKRVGNQVELPELLDAAPSASAALASADSVQNIWAVACKVLSQTQYTAMWLRYGEGLAVYEVAAALGKTRVGIRVLLHRARTVLMPHLGEDTKDVDLRQDADHDPGVPS